MVARTEGWDRPPGRLVIDGVFGPALPLSDVLLSIAEEALVDGAQSSYATAGARLQRTGMLRQLPHGTLQSLLSELLDTRPDEMTSQQCSIAIFASEAGRVTGAPQCRRMRLHSDPPS